MKYLLYIFLLLTFYCSGQTTNTAKIICWDSTSFANSNPILNCFQFGKEDSTDRIKVGDGYTRWNVLPYIGTATGSGIQFTDTITLVGTKYDLDTLYASLSGGGGSLSAIDSSDILWYAGYGLTNGDILVGETSGVDSTYFATVYDNSLKLNTADTAVILVPYLREADTLTISNRINLKLNISDTAAMLSHFVEYGDTSNMLNPYLRKGDTLTLSSRINLKVSISDTASMLNPYLRDADTLTLSNRINLKVNIADTSAMLANYLRSGAATATYLAKASNLSDVASATTSVTNLGLSSASSLNKGNITWTLDGQGGVVSTSATAYGVATIAGTITAWYILGDVSGSCVVDLKKWNGSSYATVIGSGNSPTLSSATYATAAQNGSWTSLAVAIGDRFQITVTSLSTITKLSGSFTFTKN